MLNDIRMNVVQTAKNGIVDHETIFHFKQEMNTVTATYTGGRIRAGYLVGILVEDQLNFTYCQIRDTGELDHGESHCTLKEDQRDGKLMLEEQFAMETGKVQEKGINIFKELK
jgi:hypothetical protein